MAAEWGALPWHTRGMLLPESPEAPFGLIIAPGKLRRATAVEVALCLGQRLRGLPGAGRGSSGYPRFYLANELIQRPCIVGVFPSPVLGPVGTHLLPSCSRPEASNHPPFTVARVGE